MATIKLGDALVASIKAAVCKPFNEQLTQAMQVQVDSDKEKIYRTLMPAELEATLSAIPKEWEITKRDRFGIILTSNETNALALFHLRAEFARQRPMLREWAAPHSYGWREAKKLDIEKEFGYKWPEMTLEQLNALDLSKDYAGEICAIIEERTTQLNLVTALLEKCQTLNQVTKLWPAITHYVDAETNERLNRKAERNKAELPEIDLTQLNVGHIKQRMLGGVL